MNWIKDTRYNNVFTCSESFNGYKYTIEVTVEDKIKSLRFWIAVSSGKKRKELDIFEDKKNKSLGGLKALFWIKKAVLHFPTFYHKGWMTDNTRMYICITWADSRRRDIYEKFLEKDGFSFMNIDGKKTLVKEISINE